MMVMKMMGMVVRWRMVLGTARLHSRISWRSNSRTIRPAMACTTRSRIRRRRRMWCCCRLRHCYRWNGWHTDYRNTNWWLWWRGHWCGSGRCLMAGGGGHCHRMSWRLLGRCWRWYRQIWWCRRRYRRITSAIAQGQTGRQSTWKLVFSRGRCRRKYHTARVWALKKNVIM